MCTPPSSSPHLVGQQAHFVEHGCVRFVLGVQMPHEGHLPAALGDVALDVHTVLAGKGSQSCVRGGGGGQHSMWPLNGVQSSTSSLHVAGPRQHSGFQGVH